MSNKDYSPSFFPPNVPVPDPPGAKLLVQIPVFFVGLVLLGYLFYNLYLEAVDWKILPKREVPVAEEEKFPVHPVTLDPERCYECHESPFREETRIILDANKGITPEDLPEGYDPDFFDDEKFYSQYGLTVRKDIPSPPRELPGPFLGNKACMKCHPVEDFDRQHNGHVFEPFESCTMCHTPHRSIAKPLLKETQSAMCIHCHNLNVK